MIITKKKLDEMLKEKEHECERKFEETLAKREDGRWLDDRFRFLDERINRMEHELHRMSKVRELVNEAQETLSSY